ncbi:MAG: hypothetical protein ACYC1D_00465 [Acidimicrobiales bacterium]
MTARSPTDPAPRWTRGRQRLVVLRDDCGDEAVEGTGVERAGLGGNSGRLRSQVVRNGGGDDFGPEAA